MRDYDALSVGHRELAVGELFQPWVPMEHWRGDQVPITLGRVAERFDWGVTSGTGHFLAWDEFFEHSELAGTAVPHGVVYADARSEGLRFELTGWREDIDAGINNRKGSWILPLSDTTLLCEVLATGKSRTTSRESDGRRWNLEWTLIDPRREPESLSPAEQPVWFFPGGEDWTVFRMPAGDLIRGLSAELAWLLRFSALPDRTGVDPILVLLDQAMIRCGI